MYRQIRTIQQFYIAFNNRDHATMNACYHPEATFRDPLFDLQGKRVLAMWHMLCIGGTDLKVELVDAQRTDPGITARWRARYRFGATDRRVHNRITSRFEFQGGRIIHQEDVFNFWRWSRQALGWSGWLMGWNNAYRQRVALATNRTLDKFIERHPEYQEPGSAEG